MEVNDFILIIGGIMTAIISYFLNRTMKELEDVKKESADTKGRLGILINDHENKYDALTEKMTELKGSIELLTAEIKQLNKKP